MSLLFTLHNHFDVSIHAPVRERLFLRLLFIGNFRVSIHAPVRERQVIHRVDFCCQLFQFTLP